MISLYTHTHDKKFKQNNWIDVIMDVQEYLIKKLKSRTKLILQSSDSFQNHFQEILWCFYALTIPEIPWSWQYWNKEWVWIVFHVEIFLYI